MKRIFLFLLALVVLTTIVLILRSNKNKLDMKQEISRSSVEKIPVQVDTVKKGPVVQSFSFAGILEPRDKLMVMSQTKGEVVRINSSLGDRVIKNQTIVKVDDELLKANLEVALASHEKAEKDLQRFQKMIEQDGVTRDQLEKMKLNEKNAKANLINLKKMIELTSIKAPFSGYINQMFTREGAILGPGVPVFEIVNIERFKIRLNLSEEEIIRIRKDMSVIITPKSIDSIQIKGKIEAITRSANMAQQFPVEIYADNPYPDILKGGLLVVVQIQGADRPAVIKIRKEMIRRENDDAYVYTIKDHKATKTFVTAGSDNDEFIEITRGLAAGELVVNKGIDELEDGSEVTIIRE